jgi:hypothetical protein
MAFKTAQGRLHLCNEKRTDSSITLIAMAAALNSKKRRYMEDLERYFDCQPSITKTDHSSIDNNIINFGEWQPMEGAANLLALHFNSRQHGGRPFMAAVWITSILLSILFCS